MVVGAGSGAWSLSADLQAAVALGGQMGQRFGAFDWSSHPLGSPADWPGEWQALTAMALTSRFPIVLWLGEDLRLVYNDAYLPVLGERHPDALGRAGKEVWNDIWDPIGPMLAGVVESGVATWSKDLLLPVQTGGRPEERYFTFTYSPIFDTAGAVDGIFCAVNETTERVLGQRRLQLLTALGAALMNTKSEAEVVDAAISCCEEFHADVPFLAVYLDDAGTGEPVLQQATTDVKDVLADSDVAFLLSLVDERPDGARLVTDLAARLPMTDRPGAPVVDRALLAPLSDPAGGRPVGRMLVGLNPMRPLDEQYEGFCRLLCDQVAAALANVRAYEMEQRRADALAGLDQAKSLFLANVSHEFRTPLTLLLGPLEDAIDASGDDDEQMQRLSTAHRSAQRLLRLVNTLLDFSRLQAGQTSPNVQQVNLGRLTAEIASSFTEICARAGLELSLECDPAVAAVDVQMWETVVLNLLSNAVKYTLHGSIRVVVSAPDETTVRCQVLDTGIGIAAEDLDKLFERFYRASNVRGRSVEGSGVGLSLVRGLVEAHGGTVDIRSEPDAGTTVTITLPAMPADAADERLPASAGPVTGRRPAAMPYVLEAESWLRTVLGGTGPHAGDSPAASGPRDGRALILVADDNADMREHLQRILDQHCSVVAYGDGQSALAGVCTHQPDLVITDVMMPTLDGFALTQAIRADPTIAHTPILMLSARAGVEAAGEGLAAGADDYLAKPFTSRELLDRTRAKLRVAARAQQARAGAERDVETAEIRAQLGSMLSTAHSTDEVLAALAATPALSREAGVVALGVLDADRERIRVAYTDLADAEPDATDPDERNHIAAQDASHPIAVVARTGQATVTDVPALSPGGRRHRPDAPPVIAYPLRAGDGAVLGVVALRWPKPEPARPEADAQISEVIALTAGALERLRNSDREHRIVTDLQDRLLALDPRTSTAVVAAAYRPAAEAMRIGGDWYMTVDLPEPHCLGVAVGDVVGHGLAAATVMSQLRSALGGAALADTDPQKALALLDRYGATIHGARCTTAAYAVLDTRAHTVTYACAGHPYPVLLEPDGEPQLLTGGRRPPLAVLARTPPSDAPTHPCAPGSLLVLYSDGLIERRHESLEAGFARLTDALGQCRQLPAAEVCAYLLRQLEPIGGYTDDVVVTAVRTPCNTRGTFIDVIPAEMKQIPAFRSRLRAWLAATCLPDPLTYDALLAVGEAVNNAIEHGSRDDPQSAVSVEAFADTAGIRVAVSDRGQWTHDDSRRANGRGRGRILMRGLASTFTTHRSRQGTRVTLTFQRPHTAAEEARS